MINRNIYLSIIIRLHTKNKKPLKIAAEDGIS